MPSPVRLACALSAAAFACAVHAADPGFDTATIQKLTGLEGRFDETDEKVFRVSLPRSEPKVGVDRWPVPPAMALTSWAAFTAVKSGTLMVGDLVLFEDEVNPAMSAALDAGLEVTGLHGRFFFDRPRVHFMRIGAIGDASRLAGGVRAVVDRVAQVRSARAVPADAFPGNIAAPSSITPAPLQEVFGRAVQARDGMATVVIGRTAEFRGETLGAAMGVASRATFAGSDEQAVVDGEFALRDDELQTVLKALRAGGIQVVAIHQRMTHEQPRILYVHYWGKGKAVDLASAVQKALNAQRMVM